MKVHATHTKYRKFICKMDLKTTEVKANMISVLITAKILD